MPNGEGKEVSEAPTPQPELQPKPGESLTAFMERVVNSKMQFPEPQWYPARDEAGEGRWKIPEISSEEAQAKYRAMMARLGIEDPKVEGRALQGVASHLREGFDILIAGLTGKLPGKLPT